MIGMACIGAVILYAGIVFRFAWILHIAVHAWSKFLFTANTRRIYLVFRPLLYLSMQFYFPVKFATLEANIVIDAVKV